MAFSVADIRLRRWPTIWAVSIALGLGLCVLGCGSDSAADDSDVALDAEEAKKVLLKLPYRYKFVEVEVPEGASAAVAGRAYGRHRTSLIFGVALGDQPKPVSMPNAQLGEVAGTPYFTYSSNLLEPGKKGRWERGKQLHTQAQWNEAINMVFEMEQKLCRAATGKPCPV